MRPIKPLKITTLIITTLGLASCALHLNESQCRSINWYDKGMQDGSQGDNPHDLSGAIQDCAKFNLKVNTRAYQKGWRAGTRLFCQPNNGFNIGTQGGSFNPICPSNQMAAFTAAYQRGLRRYCIPSTGYELGRSGRDLPTFCAADLRVPFTNAYRRGQRIYSQVAQLQNQLRDVNDQINTIRDQIDHNNRIIDRDKPGAHHKKQRRIAKRENRDLQAALDRLNDTKNSLEQQISAILGNS